MPSKHKFNPLERGGPRPAKASLADVLFDQMNEALMDTRFGATLVSNYYGQPVVFNETGVRVGWLFNPESGNLRPLNQHGVLVDGDRVLSHYHAEVGFDGYVRLQDAGPMPEVINVGA